MKKRKQDILLLLMFMIFFLLCGCKKQEISKQAEINNIEDLTGKKVGVVTGSVFDKVAKKYIKDVQVEYFNNNTDLYAALDTKKIDAFIIDEPVSRILLPEKPTEKLLAVLEENECGFCFQKNDAGAKLRDQFDEFVDKCNEKEVFKEIDNIWFGNDESLKIVDTDSLTGENGTLTMAISSTFPPFVYMKDGKVVGYEIDIATRFCKEYGYALKITDSNFSSLVASITAGKSDFGAACIFITEERKEGMNFSKPTYVGGSVLIVNNNTYTKTNSTNAIYDNFTKTFIRENRWKLFTQGIGITVFITMLSCIFGTIIGFLIYLIYRKRNKIFNNIINVFMDILEKTPVVVILMILYYVLFGEIEISGIWVSVVGFTFMFACGFVRVVDVGVMAVDKGQKEAAFALGFTDIKTFLFIILPQAAKYFLPSYRSNIVSLLKDTAIVGYIAVQDLTKVGDIVRSRTYAAFFPLIATAIIYFLLAWILTLIVRKIEFNFDSKNRSKKNIMKGVKTK